MQPEAITALTHTQPHFTTNTATIDVPYPWVWVWVLMMGCCAEAFTAAVLIGVVRLPGCPFGSAWCLVCEVCRLGRLG